MKKYKHYYWLLDQRFDFLIPWFQTYFEIEDRRDITFVGSFHGSARKGKEWEGVTKELVGISKNGKPVYVGRDSDTIDEAQWLEPEDINRAYRDRIQDGSFVISFSGADLPDGVDSFISTGEIATKLNNKWEQYQLLLGKNGILTPATDRLDSGEEDAVKRKEELKNKESLMRRSAKCGKVVIKKPDLSGGYRMQVITEDCDFENYCSSLSEEELRGEFLISEYIPHKQSFAGIGIVSNQKGKRKVHYCGTTEQVLYHDVAYEGLIWPPFWNTESRKSVQKRKETIEEFTIKIGKLLAGQGYFGFYNVDYVEEEKTGRMYAIEINARFGFSTLFYAIYCGENRFFDAIQGNKPPVMEEDKSDGDRKLLGKIKGITGKSYGGLFGLSDIEKWYDEKGSFRTYYLQNETFKYGSFAGLFGETLSMSIDRSNTIAKFMDICLLRGKRMLSMYVDNYCGFEKECFNFDLNKRYHIKKDDNKYLCERHLDNRFERFWNAGNRPVEDKNVSSLTIMVGKNGSGKTTLMRLAAKWLSQLAIGVYPEEEGIIIFDTGDGQDILISFSNGKHLLGVDVESTHCRLIDISVMRNLLNDIGILYYTETMTDLGLDVLLPNNQWNKINEKVLIDNSEVHEQSRYISTYSTFTMPLMIIRNRELRHVLNVWDTFGLEKVPVEYIRITIKGITEDELRKFITNDNILSIVKDISKRIDNYAWELILFWFMIGLLNVKLNQLSNNEIDDGQNNFIPLIDTLTSMASTYNVSDNKVWETALTDINFSLNNSVVSEHFDFCSFIEIIKNNNGQWLSSKYKNVHLQYRLSILNKNDLEKKSLYELLEICSSNSISELFSENVIFDIGFQSSGERNRTGLLASFSRCLKMNKQYFICFLDEPDNSFHPAWKQTLVNDLLELFEDFPFGIQAFISSHSPIILSDTPNSAAILFDTEEDRGLIKGKTDEYSGKKLTKKPQHSPFGQQIYTLYYDSFFMKQGIIGSFAGSKIQTVDKTLSEIRDQIKTDCSTDILMQLEQKLKDCENIIDLVDEPLIGGYLRHKLKCCQRELVIKDHTSKGSIM